MAAATKQRSPDVMESAATIARRTLQLPHPFEDMGCQLMRQQASTVFERAGDGTATSLVLTEALVRRAQPYVSAGGDLRALIQGLERGGRVALAEVHRQATSIELPAEIAAVVGSVVGDAGLARMIGEALDAVGLDGAILVEDGHGSEPTAEYVNGLRWNEGYVSHFLLDEGSISINAPQPRILVTDHSLATADHLLPIVELCVAAGERSLMVIAPEIRDSALGLLILNRQQGILTQVVAVRTPGLGEQRDQILEDIAVVTGGRCIKKHLGDALASVRLSDLGRAEQAWATRTAFGIIGGGGSPEAVRQRIRAAKADLASGGGDRYAREKTRERIGKLAGQTAVIRLASARRGDEREARSRVEAAIRVGRSALQEGVVAGGGAALVSCIAALNSTGAPEAAIGEQILAAALAAPMRVICENAGVEPALIVEESRRRGPAWTFDALQKRWVVARTEGLIDPVAVTAIALETSISVTKMVLTTDVLVRRKQLDVAIDP